MKTPDAFRDDKSKDEKAFLLLKRILEQNPEMDGNKQFHNVNEYQVAVEKFAVYPKKLGLIYLALGLASEAGEVADKIKKVIRDKGGVYDEEEKLAILREVGDVVWYATILASEIGVDMSDVLTQNYNKLAFRQKRGMIGGSGDNR